MMIPQMLILQFAPQDKDHIKSVKKKELSGHLNSAQKSTNKHRLPTNKASTGEKSKAKTKPLQKSLVARKQPKYLATRQPRSSQDRTESVDPILFQKAKDLTDFWMESTHKGKPGFNDVWALDNQDFEEMQKDKQAALSVLKHQLGA